MAGQECGACNGSGRATREREFVVRVPPGAEDGNVKTVRGAGEPGRKGTAAGDLHIILRVRPDALFTREGHDVVCEVPISITQAALGALIEVPTLYGKVRMKVPPGTQSGKVFRLRGKGMPHESSRGDQHVRVLIETPTRLTARQRELLEQLQVATGEDSVPRQRSFQHKVRETFHD